MSPKELKKFRNAYLIGVNAFQDGEIDLVNSIHTRYQVAYWDGWYDEKHRITMERIGTDWPMQTQTYWRLEDES